MRYLAALESYALFLYKRKTSVTQIVPPQPTYPKKKKTCMRSMPMFWYRHPMRSLSKRGERALRDRTKQC